MTKTEEKLTQAIEHLIVAVGTDETTSELALENARKTVAEIRKPVDLGEVKPTPSRERAEVRRRLYGKSKDGGAPLGLVISTPGGVGADRRLNTHNWATAPAFSSLGLMSAEDADQYLGNRVTDALGLNSKGDRIEALVSLAMEFGMVCVEAERERSASEDEPRHLKAA